MVCIIFGTGTGTQRSKGNNITHNLDNWRGNEIKPYILTADGKKYNFLKMGEQKYMILDIKYRSLCIVEHKRSKAR